MYYSNKSMAVIIFEVGALYRNITNQINSLLNNLDKAHKLEELTLE